MLHQNNAKLTVLLSISPDMKVLILLSLLGIAAAQMGIQRPIETQNQWQQQPQQNQWQQQPQQLPGNNWNNQPQQLPSNNWNNQPQQQQPSWQQRPWNNQVTRVPPQPVEVEPWLIRPETRCPEVGDNHHWALVIPHLRDQQALTVCLGGVGSEYLFK